MNIKTIAFIAMTLMALTSCNKKAAKDNHPQKEEAKVEVFRPEVLLGDSIKTLLYQKSIIYDSTGNSEYTFENKKFADIEFEAVEINSYRNDSKILRNVAYGTMVYNTEMKEKYAQALSFLKKQYGEPNTEKRENGVDNVATFTTAIWNRGNYLISLFSIAPHNELRGSLIILFAKPEDKDVLKAFFN